MGRFNNYKEREGVPFKYVRTWRHLHANEIQEATQLERIEWLEDECNRIQ